MNDIIRIIGDTHGDYQWYKHATMAANLTDIRTFHVGDFGIGFRNDRWDRYWMDDPDNLAEMNRAIGGNHDNPLYVRNCPLFVPRYHYDEKIFSMHGAASIDKHWRTENVNWWEKEELTWSEMNEARELYLDSKPDVVITHDGPVDALKCMFPYQMMNPDIRPSRTQMFLQSLFEEHKPKFWFFGHWHHTLQCEWEECIFQCIGIKDWVDFDFNKMEIL